MTAEWLAGCGRNAADETVLDEFTPSRPRALADLPSLNGPLKDAGWLEGHPGRHAGSGVGVRGLPLPSLPRLSVTPPPVHITDDDGRVGDDYGKHDEQLHGPSKHPHPGRRVVEHPCQVQNLNHHADRHGDPEEDADLGPVP